jgi:hypothetical protein
MLSRHRTALLRSGHQELPFQAGVDRKGLDKAWLLVPHARVSTLMDLGAYPRQAKLPHWPIPAL